MLAICEYGKDNMEGNINWTKRKLRLIYKKLQSFNLSKKKKKKKKIEAP